MGLQTLESMLACNKAAQQQEKEKKPRPADMQSLKCPRCDSSNTKFCYYNNYSLSQPRYFCKSCRRYWTKGGTLRNVPVGGGCRRNKRSSSSSSSSSSSKRSQDQSPIPSMPPLTYDSSDLSLAIARLQKQNSGHYDDRDFSIWGHHPSMASHHHHHHSSGGDGLGSFGANPSSSGMFDAIRAGFLENPTGGMGNGYYGNGNVEVENGGMGMSGAHEMGIGCEEYAATTTTASTAVTTVKQEISGPRDGEGRILWGFPWQSAGGGDGNGSDFDSARLNWNGLASSNWQGLLNSPLM